MRILKAVLTDYKRIRLNNVKTVEYTPSEPLQVILGTNGSGKSSLLSELVLLPTVRTDYGPDGFKETDVSHNNAHYRLTFDYAKGAYGFSLNGDELNNGGTKSGYATLVLEHFGVTPQIQDLALNTTGFSHMGIAERKYWFGLLSSSNHSYAISVFKELSSTLRDVSGSIKISQSRLATETSRALSEQEMETVEHDYKALSMEQDYLTSTLKDVPISKHDAVSRLEQALSRRTVLENRIKEHTELDPDKLDILRTEYSTLKGAISSIHDEVVGLNKELIDAEERVKEITDIESKDKIKETLETLKADLKSITLPEYMYDLPTMFTPAWEQSVEAIRNTAQSIADITDDIGVDIDTDSIEKRIAVLDTEITDTIRHVSKLVEQDKLYSKLNKDGVVCDSCGNIVGVTHAHKSHEDQVNELETKRTRLVEERNNLKDTLERHQMRSSAISLLNSTLVGVLRLRPLERILEAHTVVTHIHEIIQTIEEVIRYLPDLKRYTRTQDEISKKEHDLKSALNTDKRLVDELLNRVDRIKEAIKKKQESINIKVLRKQILASQIAKTEDMVKQVSEIETLNTETIPTLEQRLRDLDENDNTRLRLQKLRVELATLSDKLNASKEQDKVIKDLEEQLKLLNTRKEVLSIMVKNLSPTEGIIAESISGSMRSVLDTVNDIIARIWTYPLVILPCTTDKDVLEMNYKFPVQVGNDNAIVSDISKMSTSMKEIVDLAFRITALSILGVKPYPLYLDEFGKSFDAVHRERAYRMIEEQLLPAEEISQIFMVSHFMENYGAMTNCDVNIISPDNIDIPPVDYNSAITFT